MGRRRQQKRHNKFAHGESQHAPDPLSRCVAAHPSEPLLAMAAGTRIVVLDVGDSPRVITEYLAPSGGDGGAVVRVLAFSPDGKLLMSAGDAKLVYLWDTATWTRVASWRSPKKVSAGTFTTDSRHVIFADKYGDVHVGDATVRNDPEKPQQPALLLGHLCSIVASLLASPNGRYLVSTDKERKVRVSILPDEPMLGSFEVQSYCLGHEYFVSACTWAAPSAPGAHPMLVTGSGDGTVRLWDAERGRLLDTCVVSEREEEVEADAEADMAAGAGAGDGDATAGSAATAAEGGGAAGSAAATGADSAGEDGDSGEGGDDETDDRVVYGLKCAPVTCVACSRDGLSVAALVEGRDEVTLLRVDAEARKLSRVSAEPLPGVRFPEKAAFDVRGRLWVTGGAPLDASKSLHVAVAEVPAGGIGGVPAPVTDAVLPGELRARVEARAEDEESQLASGTLVPAYTQQLMIMRRRWFTPENLESAKRLRKSYPESERLRQLAEQHEAAQAAP